MQRSRNIGQQPPAYAYDKLHPGSERGLLLVARV
jgi:hypothetical protein